MGRIAREQKVQQSVQDYVRGKVFTEWGYPEDQVELVDSFNADDYEGGLSKNVIAVGYNFDDGGSAAELGSDLVRRVYTIELFCLGATPTWAQNLSGIVKEALESERRIPLREIGDPARPIIDYLIVDDVTNEREVISDPAPWQRYIWTVRVRVEDEYFANLLG